MVPKFFCSVLFEFNPTEYVLLNEHQGEKIFIAEHSTLYICTEILRPDDCNE